MTKGKSAADVTNVPAGLDMTITQPGTIVGGHDLQGTDGTTRTDRPGEILGTPVVTAASAGQLSGRELEEARADHIRAEVDRANREDLPKLGGQIEDTWAPPEAPLTNHTPADR